MAVMLPYSMAIMATGLALTIGWVVLDLPLGPGASVFAGVPGAGRADEAGSGGVGVVRPDIG